MATVLPSGYGSWICTWTLDGSTKIFQSVWMVSNESPSTVSVLNTAMRGYWCSAGRPFVAANMFVGYTLASTEAYLNTGGVITYDIVEAPIVGTKASSLGTPINTSLLVKKNTLIVGRRYQGRFMWPNLYIAEADISQAGIISSTPRATYEDIIDEALTAQIVAGGWLPHLGHSSSEVAPTPYASITLQPKIGTMRRRIRGF